MHYKKPSKDAGIAKKKTQTGTTSRTPYSGFEVRQRPEFDN